MKNYRIHIFGASGSGVTTLGKVLGEHLDIPVFDYDDYYWEDTDIPFIQERPKEKRLELIKKNIGDKQSYIIAGHYSYYAYELDENLTMAIFLYTSSDIRKKRLKERELNNFGDRILEGGDMHENAKAFIEWSMGYDDSSVSGRTLKRHYERILYLNCPVIKLDGSKTVDELIKDLKNINVII